MEDNIKHDNYDNPCHITISKHEEDDLYTLRYEDEDYEYLCSKEELLEELSEHLNLMVEKE